MNIEITINGPYWYYIFVATVAYYSSAVIFITPFVLLMQKIMKDEE